METFTLQIFVTQNSLNYNGMNYTHKQATQSAYENLNEIANLHSITIIRNLKREMKQCQHYTVSDKQGDAIILSWKAFQIGYKLHKNPNCSRQSASSISTFTSFSSLYSMISVHKLLDAIVPRFCWLLLRLQESLYSMYGVPVSIWAVIIASHNFRAGIVFLPRPSFSYLQK